MQTEGTSRAVKGDSRCLEETDVRPQWGDGRKNGVIEEVEDGVNTKEGQFA